MYPDRCSEIDVPEVSRCEEDGLGSMFQLCLVLVFKLYV